MRAVDVISIHLPRSHPLTRMPNVIMTPHIGWVSAASIAAF